MVVRGGDWALGELRAAGLLCWFQQTQLKNRLVVLFFKEKENILVLPFRS